VSKRKGSDVFVAAARLVMRDEPAVEFRMVGPLANGPEREWARALVESASSAGVVHARADDPFAELAAWDVFVLPSRQDPFPLAVLEAMASGLPVVASAIDGIVEQVIPGAGILLEPDDPTAFADAISRLMQAPERRAQMGSTARRHVTDNLTVERQADGLEGAYLGAIANRGVSKPESGTDSKAAHAQDGWTA
jgi:glycosyltransferase involved in cell wall biosynthesis